MPANVKAEKAIRQDIVNSVANDMGGMPWYALQASLVDTSKNLI